MINLKYSFDPKIDHYYWSRATVSDAKEIGQLAYDNYAGEISEFFTPSATSVEWNIKRDIVDQEYNVLRSFVSVARSTVTGKIIAYTWFGREYMTWSPDECVSAKMMHVTLDQTPRQRVRLVNQMIDLLHCWAHNCDVKVLCSTTVRDSQDAFLKIHANRGFTVRGSYCFKRLNYETDQK